MALTLNVNNTSYTVDVEPETPLLWVLRDNIGLTGTKYGCGIAKCGFCTVHINGQATKSCQTKASAAVGQSITTIEGLSADSDHPVQVAWIEKGVPQCGYCQSGQIMAAAALLAKRPSPSDADIDQAMDDSLCRCGTYNYIRSAIHRAAEIAAG
jgi:aerobic-type carbon monoxide dehydrogenase small subunit (CoxS/CutS family)